MSVNSLEWARDLRDDLIAEIRTLTARGGGDDSDVEALGLVPQSDHLADLQERLAQVERLIDAIEGSDTSRNAGWFPAMTPDTASAHAATAS